MRTARNLSTSKIALEVFQMLPLENNCWFIEREKVKSAQDPSWGPVKKFNGFYFLVFCCG
jgi:hypothetical protein